MSESGKRLYKKPNDWAHEIPLRAHLLKRLGAIPAILLTILLERDKETAQKDRKHIIGGWFALSYAEIADITSFSKTRITDGLNNLKKGKYIESETRGIPHVQYYRIDRKQVHTITLNNQNLSPDISKTSRAWKANSRELENQSVNTTPNSVFSNPNNISELNTSLGNSIRSSPETPIRIKKINDVILPILREAVRLGGFKNIFPGPGKAPTKGLLEAQKFLQSAFSGRLTRDYPIELKEGEEPRSFVRYLKESGRTLEEVLYEACERFNLLRGPDYGKRKLTENISAFFYNPIMRRSWFLALVFEPPRILGSKIIEKDYDALPLGPKTREAVEVLRGENWDPIVFKKKVIDLYAWYQANQEDLRVCAAYIDATNRWDQHFGSFKALCETIRDFARGWDDWKPANFGYGNPTWARFVVKVREDHQGLDLSPPTRKLEAAKIQWQRSQSGALEKQKKYDAEKAAFEAREEAFRKGLLDEKGDEK